jgi:cytochrome P450
MHPYTFKLVNFVAGMSGQVDRSIDFTMKQISERQSHQKPASEGPPDMLTKLLETQAQNPEKYTDWHVLMGAFTNIVAGADTSWALLDGILYHLIKNPEPLRKLRQEIEDMSSEGTLSNPAKFKEAQRMPYLQAVLKEGQRMFPPTGFPLWRVVPEHGVTMSGKFFPPGVRNASALICPTYYSEADLLCRYNLDYRRYKHLGSPSQLHSVRS